MNTRQIKFHAALDLIQETYENLKDASHSPEKIRALIINDLKNPIDVVFTTLKTEPRKILEMSEPQVLACFEFRAIQLLQAPLDRLTDTFKEIEEELYSILQIDEPNVRLAGKTLLGCLLLSLEDLVSISDKILALLGTLTGRKEGINQNTSNASPVQLHPKTSLDLSKLLDYGLFSEVYTFLAGIRPLQNNQALLELEQYKSSIISIASRKGGVGKSTFALATMVSQLRQNESTRICIIDLDITGPIWQYLLCPNGITKQGEPIPYLNNLLQIAPAAGGIVFDGSNPTKILDCVAEVEVPSFKCSIGLMTFADLPRMNRYIVQAIANDRGAFTDFMISILKALEEHYDLIIVDNTPGFDPHPMLMLVIAGIVPKGIPVVVGTESLPDIRGTSLELSDLRLIQTRRPPLWVINKAGLRTDQFFSEPHTIVEIAKETPGYANIIPSAPLLEKLLSPYKVDYLAHPLPFDEKLARPGLIDNAGVITQATIESFIDSQLFERFTKKFSKMLNMERELHP